MHSQRVTVSGGCPFFFECRLARHTAHAAVDLLFTNFCNRVIKRLGVVNEPPRICYLTPLVVFVGYRHEPMLCKQSINDLGSQRRMLSKPFVRYSLKPSETVFHEEAHNLYTH